jgi:hypothetical protein
MTTSWTTGHLSQHGRTLDRSAALLSVDHMYPTERSTLAASVATEILNRHVEPVWRVNAAYDHPGGHQVSVSTFRETPWLPAAEDSRQEYSRAIDLSRIPAGFHDTGVKAGGSVAIGDHQAVQAHGAVRSFSDGNRETEAYVQYQVPISDRQATWIALQPYGYTEQWRRTEPGYFSPARQTTIGLTGRAIITRGPWTTDVSLRPQQLIGEDKSGPGFAAMASVRRQVGKGAIDVSYMIFEDRRYAYRLQRGMVTAVIPIGK